MCFFKLECFLGVVEACIKLNLCWLRLATNVFHKTTKCVLIWWHHTLHPLRHHGRQTLRRPQDSCFLVFMSCCNPFQLSVHSNFDLLLTNKIRQRFQYISGYNTYDYNVCLARSSLPGWLWRSKLLYVVSCLWRGPLGKELRKASSWQSAENWGPHSDIL